MNMTTLEDDGKTAKVKLEGKLDIMGAEVIALPLATLSGTRENIVIDMSDVTFLASIGIRHLVSAAKGVSRRNGRVFLLKPTSFVVDVITTSGLEDILHLAATDAEVPSFGHV